MRRFDRKNLRRSFANTAHLTAVNYEVSVDEMVARGAYSLWNKYVNSENFPTSGGKGKAKIELIMVHLGRKVSSEEVLTHLEDNGMRPGTIEELLALGAEHPDVFLNDPVVCLGSSWLYDGCPFAPVLAGGENKSLLLLLDPTGGWKKICCFLAVRK